MSPPFAETGPPQDAAPSPGARPSTAAQRLTQPWDAFPPDAGDPVARFLRHHLHANWPQLLIVAWILYGPLEKLVLPWLGGYGNLVGDVTKWLPDLESMLTGFVEFPLFFGFYLWSGGDIANVFQRLAENGSFRSEARYLDFVRRVHTVFAQSRWWVLGILLAVGTVLAAQFILWSSTQTHLVIPWFDVKRVPLLLPRVSSLALVGIVAYVVSQILIRETLAIIWWRRLWRVLGDDLVLHPYHPDDAAGLGAIGRHAIGVSYCLLGMTLFVFMGSLVPSLRSGGPKVIYSTVDTVNVTASGVARSRKSRSVSYSARCDVEARRCAATFEPFTMALTDASVLRVRIVRLPSKWEALDTSAQIDTVQRTVSPVGVSMYVNPETFEITLESIRHPLPPGIPTLRVFGITLSFWTPLLAVVWTLLLAVIVLSLGHLLWPAHVAMEQALDLQLGALSRDLDDYFRAAGDPATMATTLGAITTIKQIRTTLLDDCETWPLSKSLRRHLGVSSALSIGSSLLNVGATATLHLLRQLG